MAKVGPVTLTIERTLNPQQVSIQVGYVVTASNHDLESDQHYRETCVLIGDDPGEANDLVLAGGTMYDDTTVFDGNATGFTRALQKFLAAAALDEDNAFAFQEDEIRAIVTLTAIPTKRGSNIVRVGGPVFG
jgi:hypothetical protein